MMTARIMFSSGSLISILWGVAHIIPTKPAAKGFGKISEDNKRIIQMEWVAEGLTRCFLGVLVLLISMSGRASTPAAPVSLIVYRTSAAMLLVMAGLTAPTGARTSVIPIKICPVVKTAIAILSFWEVCYKR